MQARVVAFEADGSFELVSKDDVALTVPGVVVFGGYVDATRDPGLIVGCVDEVRADVGGGVRICGRLGTDAPARSAGPAARGSGAW